CGEIPSDPVVSPVSGCVFEKELILKHLDANGETDPVNNEPLSKEQLIELKGKVIYLASKLFLATQITKPRTSGSTSIPSLLKTLQDEYDAICLNNFSLRKQLRTSKQELSNFNYLKEASCQCIARLLKELKSARDAYEQIAPQLSAKRSKDSELSTKPSPIELVENMKLETQQQSKQLSSKRTTKSKNPPANLVTNEELHKFKLQKAISGIHSPSIPGINCLEVISDREIISSAGRDGFIKIFSFIEDKVLCESKNHSKPITDLTFFSENVFEY
ncbi:MAG: Pre-mRNA-processing factor 19, partial [Paramarteilia canceri]